MAEITRLEVQARNPDRVNVYLDGAYAFSVDREVAVTAGLKVGGVVTPDDLAALRATDERKRAVAAALRLLAHRPRSEREVRQRLSQRAIAPEVIEDAVAQLRQSGLVDDAAFAAFWTENRERFNPRGARLLARELRQKGVERATVEEALSQIDEDDGARRACEKRIRLLAGLPEDEFRRKLTAFLLRRGFDFETVARAVDHAWHDSD